MTQVQAGSFLIIFFIVSAAIVFSSQVPDPGIVNEKNIDNVLSSDGYRAVFVNIWATWCKPCKEEFPDIIQLYNEFREKNIKFVSINVDYTDEKESKVIPFLKKSATPFKVHIQDFEDNQKLILRIHKKWNGAIPFTLILDKKGKISAVFTGKKNYLQFKEALLSAMSG